MKLISREAARKLGLIRYYPGEPCKHGHVVERSVNDSNCVTCTRLRQRKYNTSPKGRKTAFRNRGHRNALRRQQYAEITS
jgi:hypothetical protein